MHRLWFFCLVMLAACGTRESAQAPAAARHADPAAQNPPALVSDAPPEREVPAGAIVRGQAPAQPGQVPAAAALPADRTLADPAVYQEALRDAMHAQRAALVAAARAGQSLRGTSILDRPTPFDRAAWERDPWATALAWCQTAEAGRVHLSGSGADPALVLQSDPLPTIAAERGYALTLQARPWAPVSVYSPDRLIFANGLPYTSVVADQHGEVRVQVSVPPGTTGRARIAIASPVCQGQPEVSLHIQASSPE